MKADKLRVLHVVSVPGVGGAQAYVRAVVNGLDALNYSTAVICSDEPELVDAYAATSEVFPMAIPYRVSPWKDLCFFVRMVRILRRGRFDIVQTSAAKAGLYGRLAARLAGVPVVIFTAHGFPFHEFMNPALRWALAGMERLMSRFFTDMVVSVSEADRRYAVENGIVPEDRIMTIQNGIDVPEQTPDGAKARRSIGLDPKLPVVGMVGRLARQKAPGDFLRAAAIVQKEFPLAKFLVVGDGPLREGLEELAENLGIRENVWFMGFREDVRSIMAALDVFVLSSLWEGLPFTVLEAMAVGKPVVATEVNGVAEAVVDGKTGFLAPPGDFYRLAELVVDLLGDRPKAAAMGEKGRRRALEHFSIDRMTAKLSELYMSLYRTKKRDPLARGRQYLA